MNQGLASAQGQEGSWVAGSSSSKLHTGLHCRAWKLGRQMQRVGTPPASLEGSLTPFLS